jgi:SAM-dependent methyltransferase
MHYYSRDLALVHDRGFGQHADRCAPGILELLSPVRGGLVLELGCGSGALTRHLLAAGHRVIAADASADMLALAGSAVRGEEQLPGPLGGVAVAVGWRTVSTSRKARAQRGRRPRHGRGNP